MKKRWLAVLLTLAMCLSLLPVTAVAEGESQLVMCEPDWDSESDRYIEEANKEYCVEENIALNSNNCKIFYFGSADDYAMIPFEDLTISGPIELEPVNETEVIESLNGFACYITGTEFGAGKVSYSVDGVSYSVTFQVVLPSWGIYSAAEATEANYCGLELPFSASKTDENGGYEEYYLISTNNREVQEIAKRNEDDDISFLTVEVLEETPNIAKLTIREGFESGKQYRLKIHHNKGSNNLNLYINDTRPQLLMANPEWNNDDLLIEAENPNYITSQRLNLGGSRYCLFYFGNSDTNEMIKLEDLEVSGPIELQVLNEDKTTPALCGYAARVRSTGFGTGRVSYEMDGVEYTVTFSVQLPTYGLFSQQAYDEQYYIEDINTFALEIRDEDKRKSYMKYASRWQSHSNRVNILKDAQVYHPIPYGSFDADIYIFNCKNGTLHIDTGEFTEHDSADLLTKISPVVYDPNAYSERFDTYIDEIMSGDADKAKFLQKILGYGLTGDTRHECMTILYGVTTRNGKGTLCESVLKVLGDYGCASRPETIAMKTYTNGSQPSEDVARLAGVRFVNIPEPGKGMVLDAAKVKAMTGNDTLNARFLHENSFDFQPQFKIYVNTNFLPVINDMTLFSSDRIIIIPFDRHFDEHSRDTTLKRRFAEESVQSAILNWLLEGYRLLQAEGLFLPKSVKDATDRYQHDSDKMALFFEDNLVADDAAEELTSTVYARYKGWCQENGSYPEGMKNFKQGLQAFAKVVRKRPKTGGEKTTMLIGYRLISEFDPPLLT